MIAYIAVTVALALAYGLYEQPVLILILAAFNMGYFWLLRR